jgi:predicted N-formylglutamate amidohydrolase
MDNGASQGLLGRGDPAAFAVHRPSARSRVLISCDHASRAFPASLAFLGLAEASTWRHIAWDIGAGGLARSLGDRLDATVVLAGYSRLVIDCNRRLDDPSCFAMLADGDRVTGNEGLTEADKQARAVACHEPYHQAISIRLQEFRRRGIVPALIAIHSFTPHFAGRSRPWHVGVLWDQDGRIALPLLDRLRSEPGLVVGDNEPYSGRHSADYSIERHAESAGLAHVCIEIRQDELTNAAGIARWSEILYRALHDILADETLYGDAFASQAR